MLKFTMVKIKNPLILFYVMSLFFSWPIGILAYGKYGIKTAILYRYLGAALFMLGPSIAAIITRKAVEKRPLVEHNWRRGSWKMFLLVIGFCLLLWVIPQLVAMLFSDKSFQLHIPRDTMTVIVISLMFGWIPALGEEYGWRGYLTPRLMEKYPNCNVHVMVLVGILWGIWHFPIAIGPAIFQSAGEVNAVHAFISQLPKTVLACLQMLGASIGLAIIFGAVWIRTRSIIVVTVFHWAYNVTHDIITLTTGHSIMAMPIRGLILIPAIILSGIILKKSSER